MNFTIQQNILIQNPETKNFLADAFYPETSEKLPLVIFAHGYKGYKDWGAWNFMAEKFAEAGFFFVKFNFSHNGTTIENPKDFADLEAFGNNNFTKEMSDYDAVLNYFYDHPKIDQSKIAIIGHSRGGGISVIKAFEDERVKALISLAGVSHFGYRFPSGERLEEWKNNGVMFSENARTKQQMPHYYQFFEDYKNNEDRFSVQRCAQNLTKPFLIIQGTNDEAVKDKEPWTEDFMPKDLDIAAEKMINFLKNNFDRD